jgi:hypothetical protein
VHTEAVTSTAAGSAVISRGLWGQAGLRPAGTVNAFGPEDPSTRVSSIRADRFALLGGDLWSCTGGITSWQPLSDGALEQGNIAFPRMRLGWTPGILDDTVRAPGSLRLALWRRLDGLLAATDDRNPVLALGWRQTVEYSPPWLAGTDLRPFVAAAGRRDAPFDGGTRDWLWMAAGVRFALAAERSWDDGRSYHRFGLELRWAHVLPVALDSLGPEVPVGPGPDLLRVGLPQTLSLGGMTVTGELWLELRRLDAWQADAAVLGARVAVDGQGFSLAGHVALDGAGNPLVGSVEARVPFGAPVELAVHYAYLPAGVASALPFVPWEERLPALADPPSVARHGLGGDLFVRLLGGRIAIRAGAEADLADPALAALRVGLTLVAPERCLALDLQAELWLDQQIPNVSLALSL